MSLCIRRASRMFYACIRCTPQNKTKWHCSKTHFNLANHSTFRLWLCRWCCQQYLARHLSMILAQFASQCCTSPCGQCIAFWWILRHVPSHCSEAHAAGSRLMAVDVKARQGSSARCITLDVYVIPFPCPDLIVILVSAVAGTTILQWTQNHEIVEATFETTCLTLVLLERSSCTLEYCVSDLHDISEIERSIGYHRKLLRALGNHTANNVGA